MAQEFDLVIIGAGSGGLVAADFAATLGAKVALVEQSRVGGDCTWTGCVPSKALIKVARVAHTARTAATYGVATTQAVVDMRQVRDYVQGAVAGVYQHETPASLRERGIEVIVGQARFRDSHSLIVGERTLTGANFLLCTGAHPRQGDIAGLDAVPYVTYEQIFDNDRLPNHLIVVGGGPVGLELGQAYRRLGSAVTLVAEHLLHKEEPEVGALLEKLLAREGLARIAARVASVSAAGNAVLVTAGGTTVRGDMLLKATGRVPTVAGLDLEKAGVAYSEQGIAVDKHLRTNIHHIYAAGDCTGGYQYSHFAGWQAFQATRNALLPGNSDGFSDVVPRVTFVDPEVAAVGATEAQARASHGDGIAVSVKALARVDRAICANDTAGFIKIVHQQDGRLLGATVVADRAGEVITEFVIALQRGMKLGELAAPLHPYPTYSTPIQQMAAETAVADSLRGLSGTVIRALSQTGRS